MSEIIRLPFERWSGPLRGNCGDRECVIFDPIALLIAASENDNKFQERLTLFFLLGRS